VTPKAQGRDPIIFEARYLIFVTVPARRMRLGITRHGN